MPRSGWIALGAVVAALGNGVLPGQQGAAAETLLALAVLIGGHVLGTALPPPTGRAVRSVALVGAGALLVAVRLVLAPISPPRMPARCFRLATGHGRALS